MATEELPTSLPRENSPICEDERQASAGPSYSWTQDSVKLGLLTEAAQTHQKLAEAAIEKLNEQTQGLEAVVRGQIQHTLAHGLKSLHVETKGAVEALQRACGTGHLCVRVDLKEPGTATRLTTRSSKATERDSIKRREYAVIF